MKEESLERRNQVLKTIIHYYVETVLPVSSRTLMKKFRLPWSAATIRNIMSELEEEGLLTQPHTSAGRVPTEEGFRYYVNCLMERRLLSDSERETISRECHSQEGGLDLVLKTTSKILSEASHYPTVMLLPRADHLTLKHVEFIRLKACQILAVLVFHSGTTKTHLLLTQEDFSSEDLVRMNNYLNELIDDLTLFQIRMKISHEMEQDKIRCDRLFSKILPLSLQAFQSEEGQVSFIVAGQDLFLREPEFADIQKFRRVLNFLEEKSQIMRLLDDVMHGSGVKIFIGDKEEGLEDLTLVSAPYGSKQQVLGTLGVLGPTRMAYDHVVPLVEYTAQLLGTQFGHG